MNHKISPVVTIVLITPFLFLNSVFNTHSQDLATIDSLQKVLITQEEDTNKINNLVSLTRSYFYIGNARSVEYLDEIYTLSQKLKFIPGLADYCYLKAIHFNQWEQYDSALFYSKKALGMLDSVNDFQRQARYYRNYAIIHRKQGYPGTASIYYKKSLDLYQKIHDEDGIGKSYVSLGLLLYETMKYDSALGYFFKSLTLAEKNKNMNFQLPPLINIGKVFIDLADYENAIKYFRQCLDLSEKERNLTFIGRANQNLGIIYSLMNKNDDALKFYQKAMSYYDSIGSISESAQVIMSIGNIFRYKGDGESAMMQFRKSETLFNSIHDIPGLIHNKINMALIYEDKGNYTKTLQIYDSCLALVKTSDYHEILSLLYYNISKTHELEGNWKQAFQFQMLHHTLKDSIFNIEN
ncbi:MAG: tetratricopeptide repeat protein, partial [Bacteroidetes bacterium]|nr:tetratricopeptide repeat protein [Bacteroidota bacterium]